LEESKDQNLHQNYLKNNLYPCQVGNSLDWEFDCYYFDFEDPYYNENFPMTINLVIRNLAERVRREKQFDIKYSAISQPIIWKRNQSIEILVIIGSKSWTNNILF